MIVLRQPFQQLERADAFGRSYRMRRWPARSTSFGHYSADSSLINSTFMLTWLAPHWVGRTSLGGQQERWGHELRAAR